jgi:steroid delta-isomerase-like uncharacterized protein
VGAVGEARDVVSRLVDTLNDHDVPAGRALYADDARLLAASGHQLDLDGLERMFKMSLEAFPDMRITVERWVEDGDVVVTEEVMEGTHKGPFAGLAPSGRQVRLPMVHVTRVAGGRIVERTAYHDTAGILRQLT